MFAQRRDAAIGRAPNIDKLELVLARRGWTWNRLAERVGSSTLYSALMFRQTQALSRLCVALRCSLDDLTDAA